MVSQSKVAGAAVRRNTATPRLGVWRAEPLLLERAREAVSRHHDGVDPASDLAKLVERRSHLSSRLVDPLHRGPIAGELFLEQAELQREGHQPLLGSIVEVALQALTFILRGHDVARETPATLRAARVQPDLLREVGPSSLHCPSETTSTAPSTTLMAVSSSIA